MTQKAAPGSTPRALDTVRCVRLNVAVAQASGARWPELDGHVNLLTDGATQTRGTIAR